MALPKIPADIATPAYVLDMKALKRNMAVAARIKRETGCKILLATKAWAMPAVFPLMLDTLDGTTASGEYEARLGKRGVRQGRARLRAGLRAGRGEAADQARGPHLFQLVQQLTRTWSIVKKARRHIGLRINPGYSHVTVGGDLYNPCAPCSRFGALKADLYDVPWDDVTRCIRTRYASRWTMARSGSSSYVARAFKPYLEKVKAVNFGGGHFINRPGYDVSKLIAAIKAFRAEFGDRRVSGAGWRSCRQCRLSRVDTFLRSIRT